MELKKSPKADLQNKKGLFLEIGMIISLLFVIAAFLYAPKEYRIEHVDLDSLWRQWRFPLFSDVSFATY